MLLWLKLTGDNCQQIQHKNQPPVMSRRCLSWVSRVLVQIRGAVLCTVSDQNRLGPAPVIHVSLMLGSNVWRYFLLVSTLAHVQEGWPRA